MSDIRHVLLTKAGTFQAIVAGPTFVVLGLCAMFAIWDATWWTVYDFITFTCTAIMAGGIIFLVQVQKKLPDTSKLFTFRFELAKSVLATGMWIWLMADALWGPNRGYYSYERTRRVIMSSIAANLLFIFFYPTVVYTFFDLEREQHERQGAAQVERGEAGENTPLLSDRQRHIVESTENH